MGGGSSVWGVWGRRVRSWNSSEHRFLTDERPLLERQELLIIWRLKPNRPMETHRGLWMGLAI